MNDWPSPAETAVIVVLKNHGPQLYGGQIHKLSSRALSPGSVYTLLERLQHKGFVSSLSARPHDAGGMPRPLYELSPKGREVADLADRFKIGLTAAL